MGKPLKEEIPPIDPLRVEPPTRLDPRETIPLPDRWRLADQLKLVTPRWIDPYNPNVLKGDRPIFGTQRLVLQPRRRVGHIVRAAPCADRRGPTNI